MQDKPDRTSAAPAETELEALRRAEAMLAELAGVFGNQAGTFEQLVWSDATPGQEHAKASTPEERLRAAEERFRTLVEQIPAVTFMAVLGQGLNEIYVSPHIEAMLGYTQQQWMDDPFLWYQRLHVDDRSVWNAEFARGCKVGGPFQAECRFVASDGHIVWVHGEARLIKDAVGRPLYLQGVAFDITESKKAQEVLLDRAVQKARFDEELLIAKRVQTSLLPRRLEVSGLELAAAMVPASEVGGDYYDVLPDADGAWLAIGDVSGHGLDAGLVMLMTQSAFSAAVRTRPDALPSEILRHVNGLLHENIRLRMERDEHVTLSALRYTIDGSVTFSGAHEDIVLWRKASRRTEIVLTPGTWLGITSDLTGTNVDSTFRLEDGDVLVLYTDGITEAMAGSREQFDMARLCRAVEEAADAPVDAIKTHVLGCVRRFMNLQEDDMTLLIARYSKPKGGPSPS